MPVYHSTSVSSHPPSSASLVSICSFLTDRWSTVVFPTPARRPKDIPLTPADTRPYLRARVRVSKILLKVPFEEAVGRLGVTTSLIHPEPVLLSTKLFKLKLFCINTTQWISVDISAGRGGLQFCQLP